MKYVISSASTWCANDFLDIYSDRLSEAGFKIQVLSEDDEDKATVIIIIKTLKDLMKLIDIVGNIIVCDSVTVDEGFPKIIIYDDYVE